MEEKLNAIDKVRRFLDENDSADIEIKVIEQSIFTVEDAARAIGVDSEYILKSLIFEFAKTPCLVLMSGANQVDTKLAAMALGFTRGRMMPPDKVLENYGFRIGGVPPVGYPVRLPAVLDEDLFNYKAVWSAAGTDHAFFPVAPERLLKLTGGIKANIKKV